MVSNLAVTRYPLALTYFHASDNYEQYVFSSPSPRRLTLPLILFF